MKAYRIWFEDKYTILEDNTGDIKVATWSKLNSASNFISVQYHWFRQHVESFDIDIEKVRYQEQKGDMFAKGLQGIFFKIPKIWRLGGNSGVLRCSLPCLGGSATKLGFQLWNSGENIRS